MIAAPINTAFIGSLSAASSSYPYTGNCAANFTNPGANGERLYEFFGSHMNIGNVIGTYETSQEALAGWNNIGSASADRHAAALLAGEIGTLPAILCFPWAGVEGHFPGSESGWMFTAEGWIVAVNGISIVAAHYQTSEP